MAKRSKPVGVADPATQAQFVSIATMSVRDGFQPLLHEPGLAAAERLDRTMVLASLLEDVTTVAPRIPVAVTAQRTVQDFLAYALDPGPGWNDPVDRGVPAPWLAPRTAAGSFASAAGNLPGPVGVMASVLAAGRLFGLVGDSISQGVGGYGKALAGTLGAAPGGDAGYMAGYLAGKFDYLHLGRSGAGAVAERTNFAKRAAFAFAAGVTDIWSNLGINDLNGSNLAATNTRNAIATLFGVLKGTGTTVQRIYQSTITPGTSVSGPPSTSTNQTVLTNLQDGRRGQLNDMVRALASRGRTGSSRRRSRRRAERTRTTGATVSPPTDCTRSRRAVRRSWRGWSRRSDATQGETFQKSHRLTCSRSVLSLVSQVAVLVGKNGAA